MKKTFAAAAGLGMLALSAAADPITPGDAVTMLETAGSEDVALTWLSDDVARIDGKHDSYFYSVRMIDCGVVTGCDAAILFATFAMPGAPDLRMYERINEYNDTKPFGRAFLLVSGEDADGYIVGVDYALSLTNETTLDASDMAMFIGVLDTFVAHMSDQGEE